MDFSQKIKLCLLLSGILVFSVMDAQQRKAGQAEKKQAKTERSYERAYARARRLTIKHRRSIQTDATKKRMEEADQRAKAYNKQNDPNFLERIFKKRPPRKK
jgi:hypothetical protein